MLTAYLFPRNRSRKFLVISSCEEICVGNRGKAGPSSHAGAIAKNQNGEPEDRFAELGNLQDVSLKGSQASLQVLVEVEQQANGGRQTSVGRRVRVVDKVLVEHFATDAEAIGHAKLETTTNGIIRA